MKVRLTRRALCDRESLADYIEAWNPEASRRVVEALESAFELIAAYPWIGRAQEQNLRRFVLLRFPYLIFYRIERFDEAVSIIRIRHGAREPFRSGGSSYST